jgi:3-hydroxybutyryl-CoA dehydrogenase
MGTKIRKVAVVGTGMLGTQIAVLASCFNYNVSAYDPDSGAFKKGLENLLNISRSFSEKAIIPIDEWEKGAEKVELCKDIREALQEADLAIECVPENLEIKRRIFKSMDAFAPKKAILATNSSSIPVSKIESATTRSEKCLNIHFYMVPAGLNMVDIMGGAQTSLETFEDGKEWINSLGCIPLMVKKEILGFCFNRVWHAIKKETLYMWGEGFVDFKDIDRAWMIFTGMPRGPFGLMDMVGLDVVQDIEMVYYNESKDPKDHPPSALKNMVDRKELGVKSGKGFYLYPNPEYTMPDFIKGLTLKDTAKRD